MIDIDGHHGDGTQSVFYDEKILTISLHHLQRRASILEQGVPRRTGKAKGKGYAINVPLPFRTGDETYLKATGRWPCPPWTSIVPEIIIHQFGVDAHFSDPLVGLGLTTHAYERSPS